MSEVAKERIKSGITLILLVLTIANQSAQMLGYTPLDFDSARVEHTLSSIATGAVAIYAWWKNQNVTKKAVIAQKELDKLKSK